VWRRSSKKQSTLEKGRIDGKCKEEMDKVPDQPSGDPPQLQSCFSKKKLHTGATTKRKREPYTKSMKSIHEEEIQLKVNLREAPGIHRVDWGGKSREEVGERLRVPLQGKEGKDQNNR